MKNIHRKTKLKKKHTGGAIGEELNMQYVAKLAEIFNNPNVEWENKGVITPNEVGYNVANTESINLITEIITLPELKNNINDDNYLESDLNKLLSYLLLYKNTNQHRQHVFHIVTHDNIMINFLFKIIKSNNLYLKIITESDNVWTIILQITNLKSNEIFTLFITRSAFSIANYRNESNDLLSGKLVKMVRHTKKFLANIFEYDSPITVWGIITALLKSQDFCNNILGNSNENVVNSVIVSSLIRSWMTAVCIYLPFLQNNDKSTSTSKIINLKYELSLNISPFLKETGNDNSNKPNSFSKQLEQMAQFLNYLYNINAYLQIATKDSAFVILKNNLKAIKQYFDNRKKLFIIKDDVNVEFTLSHDTIKYHYSENIRELRTTNDINSTQLKQVSDIKSHTFKLNLNNIAIHPGKCNKSCLDAQIKCCEPFSSKISCGKNECIDKLNILPKYKSTYFCSYHGDNKISLKEFDKTHFNLNENSAVRSSLRLQNTNSYKAESRSTLLNPKPNSSRSTRRTNESKA
jgi:hypothetical protein